MSCSECMYITGHAGSCSRGLDDRADDLESRVAALEEKLARFQRVTEVDPESAPSHLNSDEASAWAQGFNAALIRLGLI